MALRGLMAHRAIPAEEALQPTSYALEWTLLLSKHS